MTVGFSISFGISAFYRRTPHSALRTSHFALRTSHYALRTAFAVHHFGSELVILAEIDEVLWKRVGLGEGLEVGELVFEPRGVGAAHERGERFARLTLGGVECDQTIDGFWAAARGDLGNHAAERAALGVGTAAGHDEVLRHHACA